MTKRTNKQTNERTTMAKKSRSQRRKKGDELETLNEGKNRVEVLDENHTIADSWTTDFSSYGDDSDNYDDDDDNNIDMDDLLKNGVRDQDQAEAAAANRDLVLQEVVASTMDEFAQEKRTAKREARLKKLFKGLSHYATGPNSFEIVASHQNQLRMACLFSLRTGSPSEQYAACRCLEILSVVFGADHEDWVESIGKYLERSVQVATRAPLVRVAALRAWAMAVFICADGDGHTSEKLMDFCESVAQETFRNEPTPVALRAAALDSWTLLASTIEDFFLAGQDEAQIGRGLVMLNMLKDCLDSGSVELRSAAGECLSLIHEARLNLGCDTEESENVTERKYQRGSWENSSWEEVMDEVKQRISELSVESGRSLSKKKRKEQRATFRDFVSTIVDDESPEEVVSFRNGAQLTLSTWREIVQLNFVRHCLQSGFQIQLLTNVTLQMIFSADGRVINASGGLSQLEKRLYMSKGSEAAKEAHIDLTRRRDKRENIKNHFLTADGEDI
mmetsp:Transcript_17921/g.38960  ORF Transcript_17921/g.38960 Transcript_17921/m.38960 type:complete len:504 (-) Transcript_17921:1456-2967(-)